MANGNEILAAVLSLHEATDLGFRRIEAEMAGGFARIGALETRADRFEAKVLARFDAMDERFDTMDVRFNAMDERFDTMDVRFNAMDERFDAMDERFDAMDVRFDAMDVRFDAMDVRFDAMDVRFDAVECVSAPSSRVSLLSAPASPPSNVAAPRYKIGTCGAASVRVRPRYRGSS